MHHRQKLAKKLTFVIVFGAGSIFFSAYPVSGLETAAFLNIPVGAAPAALGSAYTALAMDAYAPVYNPGGLALLDSSQFSALHLNYLESVNYEFASYVHPFSSGEKSYGGVGASIQYLNTGNITGTDHFGSPTGDFSGRFASYNLGYGFPLTNNWGAGVTGKLVTETLDSVSANAYAVDLGTIYKIRSRWTAGASFTNLGSSLKLIERDETLPQAFHLGTAYGVSNYLLSVEEVLPTDGKSSFHVGAAYQPATLLQFRVGYRTDTARDAQSIAGFSAGVGFHLWGQELAYAWLPYGDLGDTHYFSLVLHMNESAKKGTGL